MSESKAWKPSDLGEPRAEWWPMDEWAAYPVGILQQDEKGRWHLPLDMDNPLPDDAVTIDTRIPLEDRKPMAEGKVPVLSYQEWLESRACKSGD